MDPPKRSGKKNGPIDLWKKLFSGKVRQTVSRFSFPSATLSVSLMVGWENVVIGLLLILIGQVFTIGMVLQDEHDYTV